MLCAAGRCEGRFLILSLCFSRKMTEIVHELNEEANMLSKAMMKGELKVCGNTEKFEGGYQHIILGLNQTLDVVYQPLKEALGVLQEKRFFPGYREVTINKRFI
jgi:hypothetical protein